MGSSGLTAVQQIDNAAPARAPRSAPPVVSRPLLHWFLRYARFYVSRHMHSVRVSQEQNLRQVAGCPLLLYMNHPSWWDPMIAAVLAAQYLPDYVHYTPIDSIALEKYRFFKKLGFFGMSRNRFESQRRLLAVATQVLSRTHSALWITPQARFSDVRERPLRLGKSLPHLARNAPNCVVMPVAIEYSYWEESKPEVLVRFGPAIPAQELKAELHGSQFLEAALERTLNELSEAAIARDEAAFRLILSGKSGVGGIYQLWQRGRALLKGKRFHSQHGEPQP